MAGITQFVTQGTATWFSWTGVQKLAANNYPAAGTYRMDSDTRQEFLGQSVGEET